MSGGTDFRLSQHNCGHLADLAEKLGVDMTTALNHVVASLHQKICNECFQTWCDRAPFVKQFVADFKRSPLP